MYTERNKTFLRCFLFGMRFFKPNFPKFLNKNYICFTVTNNNYIITILMM